MGRGRYIFHFAENVWPLVLGGMWNVYVWCIFVHFHIIFDYILCISFYRFYANKKDLPFVAYAQIVYRLYKLHYNFFFRQIVIEQKSIFSVELSEFPNAGHSHFEFVCNGKHFYFVILHSFFLKLVHRCKEHPALLFMLSHFSILVGLAWMSQNCM